jgi:hypothetical protein
MLDGLLSEILAFKSIGGDLSRFDEIYIRNLPARWIGLYYRLLQDVQQAVFIASTRSFERSHHHERI